MLKYLIWQSRLLEATTYRNSRKLCFFKYFLVKYFKYRLEKAIVVSTEIFLSSLVILMLSPSFPSFPSTLILCLRNSAKLVVLKTLSSTGLEQSILKWQLLSFFVALVGFMAINIQYQIANPILIKYVNNSRISLLFYNKMSQNLLDEITKCSKKAKSNLSEFLNQLFNSNEQAHEEIADEELNLEEIFKKNTSDLTISKAREVSKGERSEKLLINHQYNYGEISFHSVYEIFQKIKATRPIKNHEVFYDLGSGTGKVVFAAALCYPFFKCVGIEFLQSLFEFSNRLKTRSLQSKQAIEEEVKQSNPSGKPFQMPDIDFINADFKVANWSDGTIIFVSSTCYSRQVMIEIEKLCEHLAADTIIVTLTRKLENVHGFKLVQTFEGSTSWGKTTLYIHMKYS